MSEGIPSAILNYFMSSEFRGNNRSMVARSINDIKALFDKLDLIFLYRFT
jgi:hypothetical protein